MINVVGLGEEEAMHLLEESLPTVLVVVEHTFYGAVCVVGR